MVIHLEPGDSKGSRQWDGFVQNSQVASVYHLSEWRKLFEDVFGHQTYYLYSFNEAGNVNGVFPLIRMSSLLFGDFMVSLPYFSYGGPAASNEIAAAELIDAAIGLARRLGVVHVEMRETRRREYPLRSDKVVVKLSLPEDPELLWKRLGSKLRAQIRKPIKEGAQVQKGGAELISSFYQVFSRNMRDLGTPVLPESWFQQVARRFEHLSKVIVVWLEGRAVAAGFLLKNGKSTEIPWASSLREYNRFGINMLLYWEALKSAIDQDSLVFDFGRTSEGTGTHRFKKQWGGTDERLYWNYWLKDGRSLPELTPTNPRYSAAIRVWQKLPVPISVWLGPKIVKSLP